MSFIESNRPLILNRTDVYSMNYRAAPYQNSNAILVRSAITFPYEFNFNVGAVSPNSNRQAPGIAKELGVPIKCVS